MSPPSDPYTVLGVPPGASDADLRSAYRRLVRLHHPDHNNGSRESALRFEEVQEAYASVLAERRRGAAAPPPPGDLDARLADLERQAREAVAARNRAREAARRAAAAASTADDARERPSDEELGYIRTEDSFTKILADAIEDLGTRLKRIDERFGR